MELRAVEGREVELREDRGPGVSMGIEGLGPLRMKVKISSWLGRAGCNADSMSDSTATNKALRSQHT